MDQTVSHTLSGGASRLLAILADFPELALPVPPGLAQYASELHNAGMINIVLPDQHFKINAAGVEYQKTREG